MRLIAGDSLSYENFRMWETAIEIESDEKVRLKVNKPPKRRNL
ncbi:hypothetical protein LEP1GSC068_2184 [Leptospira sp. Fiocruz LV3954]|nr:hypothetical protein LEP1GSC068_2184 [Leptospira sp. Fiocruz LV3954]EMI69219.1 hypothetical protein LEP1GSC076_0389 [Leptospira sp. Fiocruz LV4135]